MSGGDAIIEKLEPANKGNTNTIYICIFAGRAIWVSRGKSSKSVFYTSRTTDISALPGRGGLRIDLVSLDRIGAKLRVDLFSLDKLCQCRDNNMPTIDFEEVPQHRA